MEEKGNPTSGRPETAPRADQAAAAPQPRRSGLRRRPSPIVDTTDGQPPEGDRTRHPSPIVDTRDGETFPGRASSIVDTMARPHGDDFDDDGDFDEDLDIDASAEDDEEFEDAEFSAAPTPPRPGDDQSIPVPVRLKGPTEAKTAGPSGPDGDRTRKLRDAHKEKVAARARARGVDPGAGSMPSATAGITRSEETHNLYLDRGRMLVQRYRRELDLPSSSMDGLDPVEFVNWFFSLKPTVSRATWRPYRQAAKAILATMPHDGTEAAIAMIDADIAEATASSETDHAPKKPSTRKEGIPRRTSGLKEKRFPKKDFDRVIAYLRYYSRSRFAPVLIDWMMAGITTGLRPIEWRATDIEVKEDAAAPGGRWVWLYVLNAKATNGRGNGLVRTIDISHFSDRTIDSVRRMSERGGQWLIDGVYDSMQSQSSQLLYAVCEKLFSARNKTYALYSMRHQFVANAKAIHRPEEVSALLGHVVTDTASENYGRKTSSWGPEEITERAKPVPEEVSTVRQRLRFFEERVRLQQEAGLIKESKKG